MYGYGRWCWLLDMSGMRGHAEATMGMIERPGRASEAAASTPRRRGVSQGRDRSGVCTILARVLRARGGGGGASRAATRGFGRM